MYNQFQHNKSDWFSYIWVGWFSYKWVLCGLAITYVNNISLYRANEGGITWVSYARFAVTPSAWRLTG